MFKITGDAVRSLQSTFVENWLESSGQILIGPKYFVSGDNTDGAQAMVVDNSPSQGGSTRARILFQTLIASARKNLRITTPYSLPDQSLSKNWFARYGSAMSACRFFFPASIVITA